MSAKLCRLSVLLVALVIVFASTIASAQSDRGSVTGTVLDPTGAVVPNVTITATNRNTGEVRTTKTSGSGDYTLPEIKADPWEIKAEAEGFQSAAANIQVGVQVMRTVDFHLRVAGGGSAVQVTADAPVVQTDNPVQQTNVTERQVRELPLAVSAETGGRTPLAFIFLDSSVTSATASTGGQGTNASSFRVNGGQAAGTEILIDGATTRRSQNGTFFSEVAPGPNAFQEFTLSTASYSAKYGVSSRGVVNFTIKSGTNGLHGEAYELFRNEWLDANSYFNNFSRTNANAKCDAPGGGNCRPRDRQS